MYEICFLQKQMQTSLDYVGDAFLYFSVTSSLQGLNNKDTDPKINPSEKKVMHSASQV